MRSFYAISAITYSKEETERTITINDTPHLEHYEWLHVWHDHANLSPEEEKNSKRILFRKYDKNLPTGDFHFSDRFSLIHFVSSPLAA